MRFQVVIPARYASTRLPGKPLVDIAGLPMVERVRRQALESGAEKVLVATDDARVEQAIKDFGGEVCMTSADHPSGTDRLAEVARQQGWGDDEIVVNVQGDEPLIPPALIRKVAEDLDAHEVAGMATLASPIHTAGELFDPHTVKVVLDQQGFALYFSRASIPWDRDAFAISTEALPESMAHYRHVGMYAYRAGFLNHYSSLAPCDMEKAESLEQLRALWHGVKIHVVVIKEAPGHGVDTAQDLDRVRRLLGF